MFQDRYNRRRALQIAAGLGAGAALSACRAPITPPIPTEAPKPAEPPAATDPKAERFKTFHHPKVEGKEVPAIQYIALPFKSGTPF